MELRQLRYFVEVAETQSITEASKRLFITHAALSNSIKALEQELGVKLFDRGGNRIALNQSGRLFRDQVIPALGILNEAKQRASDYQDKRDRTIYFEYRTPVGNLGTLMRRFRESHPDILLRTASLESPLFNHENRDVTLYASFTGKHDTGDTLLFQEEVLAVLPRNHRLAGRSRISFADLKDEPFVMGDPGELNDWIMAQCAANGYQPNLIAQTYMWSDTLSLVEEGIGCSFAGKFTWLSGLKFDVAPVALDCPTAQRNVYARVSVSHPPSKATYVFLDFIREYAREVTATAS